MTKVDIVVDIGYGDGGKGTLVDFLARMPGCGLVVRYTGGPQAAHRVVYGRDKEHTFHQFPSGAGIPGMASLLGPEMLINPISMLQEGLEIAQLERSYPWDNIYVHEDCWLVTPIHIAINRLRELARGNNRHGSCGEGVGEVRRAALVGFGIRVRDLSDTMLRNEIMKKLDKLGQWAEDEYDKFCADIDEGDPQIRTLLSWIHWTGARYQWISSWLLWYSMVKAVDSLWLHQWIHDNPKQNIVMEGSQGVLLDEDTGFFPAVTWSRTSDAPARDLLRDIGFKGEITTTGVTRAYTTRHGPGPFVSEWPQDYRLYEKGAVGNTTWQGRFRFGDLDLVALRYGIASCEGIDQLCITHLDTVCGGTPGLHGWVDSYYSPNGTPFSNIKKASGQDAESLHRREKLTKMLLECSPKRDQFPDHIKSQVIIDQIEHGLERPVKIISRGPKAADKHLMK